MSRCYEACWCPKCGGALRRNTTIARHVRYHRCVNGEINMETDESDEDDDDDPDPHCDDDPHPHCDDDPDPHCDDDPDLHCDDDPHPHCDDDPDPHCDDDPDLHCDDDPDLHCDDDPHPHCDDDPDLHCDDDDSDTNPGGDQNSNDGSNEDNTVINSDDNPEPNDGACQAERRLTDNDIDRLVLRTLKNKVKFGSSRDATLSQLRSVFELTHDQRIPYDSWACVIKKLKDLGYEPVKAMKICINEDHVTLVKEDSCPNCQRLTSACKDYYILGLNNFIESIFASSESIKKHMVHWVNREYWLNVEHLQVPRKELWHGERFRELSYFWDPEQETQLPEICSLCQTIIPVTVINENAEEGNLNVRTITCPNCLEEVDVVPRFMRGNPLNQAVIFHEDGFNAFRQKTHGTSAIHITSACVAKDQRKDSLHVYSFAPTSYIPEHIEHKFDAFLEPLVDELKQLYAYGTEILIEEEISVGNDISVQPGRYQVHVVPLLGTADIKALQELVLYASGKLLKYGNSCPSIAYL